MNYKQCGEQQYGDVEAVEHRVPYELKPEWLLFRLFQYKVSVNSRQNNAVIPITFNHAAVIFDHLISLSPFRFIVRTRQ